MINEHGHAPLSIGEDVHQHCIESPTFSSFALIIDGEAINYTFNNDELKSTFLEMIPKFR